MFGYSKKLFGEENTYSNNANAISEIVRKYNFRKYGRQIMVLEGCFFNIMIFYAHKDHIIIQYKVDIELDPAYNEAVSLQIMRLNSKHGINLALEDGYIIYIHTIFTKPYPVSEQAFSAVFETFVKKCEEVRNKLVSIAGNYALSFYDQKFEETAIEVQDEYLKQQSLKKEIQAEIEQIVKKIDEGTGIDIEDDLEDVPDDDSDLFSMLESELFDSEE